MSWDAFIRQASDIEKQHWKSQNLALHHRLAFGRQIVLADDADENWYSRVHRWSFGLRYSDFSRPLNFMHTHIA